MFSERFKINTDVRYGDHRGFHVLEKQSTNNAYDYVMYKIWSEYKFDFILFRAKNNNSWHAFEVHFFGSDIYFKKNNNIPKSKVLLMYIFRKLICYKLVCKSRTNKSINHTVVMNVSLYSLGASCRLSAHLYH